MPIARRSRALAAEHADQLDAVKNARAAWAETSRALITVADRDADLAAVADEAEDLARALESRAKTPPVADASALAGAISAAERRATLDEEWDAAVRAVRDAERFYDLAVLDLATARGEDA